MKKGMRESEFEMRISEPQRVKHAAKQQTSRVAQRRGRKQSLTGARVVSCATIMLIRAL